jgi:hypothetical protein
MGRVLHRPGRSVVSHKRKPSGGVFFIRGTGKRRLRREEAERFSVQVDKAEC